MNHSASQKDDFGKDLGLIHEVVVSGRKVGADREFWTKLAHHSNLFKQIVQIVKHGWSGISEKHVHKTLMNRFTNGSTNFDMAYMIMGAHNIISPTQVEYALEKSYSAKELSHLFSSVPFSAETLLNARNKGFRLVAGCDCSSTDFFDRLRESVSGVESKWYLIHPGMHSPNLSFKNQRNAIQEQFGPNADLAPSELILYMHYMHWRINCAKRLFKGKIVRCNNQGSEDDKTHHQTIDFCRGLPLPGDIDTFADYAVSPDVYAVAQILS